MVSLWCATHGVAEGKEPHVLEFERNNPSIYETLRLAEAGDLDRQYNLGFIYTKLRDESGPRWYKRAYDGYLARAAKGDAAAMFMIGQMHFYGNGMPEDSREAFKWFQKAADRDYKEAQRAVAAMYQFGNGVEANEQRAFYWLSRGLSPREP